MPSACHYVITSAPGFAEALATLMGTLNARLGTLQFGTRIGEKSDEGHRGVRRKNVMTYLDKLAARHPDERVWEIYEWLADASHPSYGFSTVYLANREGTAATRLSQVISLGVLSRHLCTTQRLIQRSQ